MSGIFPVLAGLAKSGQRGSCHGCAGGSTWWERSLLAERSRAAEARGRLTCALLAVLAVALGGCGSKSKTTPKDAGPWTDAESGVQDAVPDAPSLPPVDGGRDGMALLPVDGGRDGAPPSPVDGEWDGAVLPAVDGGQDVTPPLPVDGGWDVTPPMPVDGARDGTALPPVDGGRDGMPPPPVDGGRDGVLPDTGALAAHRGSAILSGAVQARSGRYRVIMSTGQSPGSNGTAASSRYKMRGGLVGATQGR